MRTPEGVTPTCGTVLSTYRREVWSRQSRTSALSRGHGTVNSRSTAPGAVLEPMSDTERYLLWRIKDSPDPRERNRNEEDEEDCSSRHHDPPARQRRQRRRFGPRGSPARRRPRN